MREQVHFVLSDVNMPGGSGPLMLRGLLNGPSSPNIAFMSGGNISTDDAFLIEHMMQDSRMLGMVQKPLDLKKVEALLISAAVRQGLMKTGHLNDMRTVDDVAVGIADETARAFEAYGIAAGGRG